MIEALVRSTTAEQVLVYISVRQRAYCKEIADAFDIEPSTVYRVTERMEAEGLLISKHNGRTREFELNPDFPLVDQIAGLFRAAAELYPLEVWRKVTDS
ncbi:MAG: ArsR family transcriptional regulator [Pseudomonadota bacterium]